MHVSLSFYTTATSTNRSVTETLVHEDVHGDLQLSKERTLASGHRVDVSQIHIFFPSEYMTSLVNGMIVKSSSNKYILDHMEDFDTHQEIYLLEVGAT